MAGVKTHSTARYGKLAAVFEEILHHIVISIQNLRVFLSTDLLVLIRCHIATAAF